jgi:hypothetical protein
LPDVYQRLELWLDRHARRKSFDFFRPGLNDCRTVQIEGNAGDVILWSTKLPHGSAANLSGRPRIAASISMQPPGDSAELRARMKRWWLTKQAPDWWRGLPGQLEIEPGDPAVLSELGMRLIGMLPWD